MVPRLVNWVAQVCHRRPKWISSSCSAILSMMVYFLALPGKATPWLQHSLMSDANGGIQQRPGILSPILVIFIFSLSLSLSLSLSKGRKTLSGAL